MRVLHVIGGVAWRYGGTTATVLSLCEALARQPGVEVEIAATDADGPSARLTSATAPQPSVPLHLFHRDYSESWKFSTGLFLWLRRHARDFDLIHIHGVWSFATTAAAWAARRHGIPYVILPQGMLSPYGWNRSYLAKRIYWRLLERQNLAQAARLIVTSTGERNEVTRLGLPTPVITIPLGLESAAWETPSRPSLLRELCHCNDRGQFIILYLSRLHPKKGLAEFLLPAVKAMTRSVFLAIAGGGDPHAPGYVDHVRAEIRRLGLTDRVALLGPIASAGRWALFDGADAFVLPSHNENFGLVVTEAMARSCPVVVFDGVFSSEHVARAGAGMVIEPSIQSLTAALEVMLADQAARVEMGRRGREYVLRFGWDQIAGDVLDLYRNCLAPGPCPGQTSHFISSPEPANR